MEAALVGDELGPGGVGRDRGAGPGRRRRGAAAVRLGTTKGSFYWHFRSRDALVAAALKLWDETHTEGVIRAVQAEPDPAARLRALFVGVTPSPMAPIEVTYSPQPTTRWSRPLCAVRSPVVSGT
jgi:AcrR family transcriptional regulator